MIIEIYGEIPEGVTCCECGCTDRYIDLVPMMDGESWVCVECFSEECYLQEEHLRDHWMVE